MSSTVLLYISIFLLFSFLRVSNIYCLSHDPEYRLPLLVVSDISSRLGAHSAHTGKESRLPLPTPQDLEAIKKVAQILVILGEQVIPSILGETQPGSNKEDVVPITSVDVPNDALNKQA